MADILVKDYLLKTELVYSRNTNEFGRLIVCAANETLGMEEIYVEDVLKKIKKDEPRSEIKKLLDEFGLLKKANNGNGPLSIDLDKFSQAQVTKIGKGLVKELS